jgi:2-polyprenyl-3-methyl-5-hydroxy-6-metoxy-1,4-benzoquinol methylase
LTAKPASSEYSLQHVHFLDEEVPALLEFGLSLRKRVVNRLDIIDLGSGDGRLLFALHRKGLLREADEIVGVDLSPKRIERLVRELPFVKGLISDASRIRELPGTRFDFAICSQLIEHIPNDRALVSEIRRLLKNKGLAYLSSVIKMRHGAYFYSMNGSFRLDPTHIREYSSQAEFVDLIKKSGLEIVGVNNERIVFPVLDLALRFFIKSGLVKPSSTFYLRHRVLSRIRKLRVLIAGYRSVEVLVRRE